MAMNNDPTLQSTTQSIIIKHSVEETELTEVTSAAEMVEPYSIITSKAIRPEPPIAIDTVFRAISVYLGSADLLSCSQVGYNCYWITKEIFEQCNNLTVPSLRVLNRKLVKARRVQNIGHLTLQSFRYFGLSHDDIRQLAAEHPKLKYLNQLTINCKDYFLSNNFHHLMRKVGHKLQTLCIKVPIVYHHSSGENGSYARQGQKELLFPIYKKIQDTSAIYKNNTAASAAGQLMEYRNKNKLQLYCNYMEIGFGISITGIAVTFPNLVELYLKDVFAKYNTDDFVPTTPSNQVKPADLKGSPLSKPQRPLPKLPSLRKLKIIYKNVHASRTKTQLTILTGMELQLTHLELVNVSCYANAEIIMNFLGKQAKTLQVLKLTTRNYVHFERLSLPGRFVKFFLPGTFLKLGEITLAKLFINDKFKETLQAIPNATKITFQLMKGEIWESILQRTNLRQSNQLQAQPKYDKPKMSKMSQPKLMPTITHNKMKVIYINNGVVGINKEDSLKELKQVFPNCAKISFNSSNI